MASPSLAREMVPLTSALKSSKPRLVFPVLLRVLVASVALNVVALGTGLWVVEGRGGMNYLLTIATKNPALHVDPIAMEMETQFRSYPVPTTRPVVFLGDSMTSMYNWTEALGNPNVVNRGIGNDTSAGVLARLGTVLRTRPAAVFLMIGTNDKGNLGYAPEDTVRNINQMVEQIHASVPDCRVVVQALLPSRAPKFVRWSTALNALLPTVPNVAHLDFHAAFEDAGGLLRAELTTDGTHLNTAGYEIWRGRIEAFVAAPRPL